MNAEGRGCGRYLSGGSEENDDQDRQLCAGDSNRVPTEYVSNLTSYDNLFGTFFECI